MKHGIGRHKPVGNQGELIYWALTKPIYHTAYLKTERAVAKRNH